MFTSYKLKSRFVLLVLLFLGPLSGCGRMGYTLNNSNPLNTISTNAPTKFSDQTNTPDSAIGFADAGDAGVGQDAASCQMFSQTIAIVSDADDCQYFAGLWSFTNQVSNYMGRTPPNDGWAAYRFALSTALPTQAVVTQASIRFFSGIGDDPGPDPNLFLFISVDDSADSAAVSVLEPLPDVSTRKLADGFAAPVRWPSTGYLDTIFLANAFNTTPDVSSLVQALLGKYNGLAANAHINFFIRNTGLGAATNTDVGVRDFFGTNASTLNQRAQLTIQWKENCP